MQFALRAFIGVALWAATSASAALAEIPQTALRAFADGRFVIAATLAESNGSTEALAFAARARVADAITREDGLCLDCLLQAEATAEAAIKRDPNFAEAYVQLAIAIGFRGRLVSALDAQSEGLAEKGRAAIDRALECDPNNAWARAALGGWHLEIVRRAGSTLAAVLYDAHEEDGLANFRKALAEDPGSLLVHFHFALSILALDPKRFRDEALAALEASAKDAHDDAMNKFTRARADKLMEALKTGSLEDIEALVHHDQGYPQDAR